MSNVIQSILPSLSTCNSRLPYITWASAFSQQEINGGNQPFVRAPKRPGAPVIQLTKTQNPRKVPFITGVWEFWTGRAIPLTKTPKLPLLMGLLGDFDFGEVLPPGRPGVSPHGRMAEISHYFLVD